MKGYITGLTTGIEILRNVVFVVFSLGFLYMVQPQLNKLKVSDILMHLVTLVLSWIHFTNKFVGTNKNYVGKVPIM